MPRSELNDDGLISSKPRFAVTNLRQALSSVSSPALPVNRQRKLEESSLDAARAALEYAAEQLDKRGVSSVNESTLQSQQLQSWMHEWLVTLTERLTADIAAIKARVDANPEQPRRQAISANKTFSMHESNLLLYLTLLPVETMALITVLETMRTIGAGGIDEGFKTIRGMMGIGKAVETEYRTETIKGVSGVDSSHWLRTIDQATQKPSRYLIGSLWRSIGVQLQHEESGQHLEQDWRAVWTPSWSASVHTDVGGFLMAALLDVAKVERTGTDPMTGQTM